MYSATNENMEENMQCQRAPRLPLTHPDRIRARDLKLYTRDEERTATEGIE